MSKIPLDIETIPGQAAAVLEALRADAEAEKAECRAPGNYKDPEKIAANIAEQHAAIDAAVMDKWRKTSFDGAFGQIAVVSFAIDGGEPVKVYRDDWQAPGAEAALLEELRDAMHDRLNPKTELAVQIIGHHVSGFDLRFLVQRSIILGVRPHPVLMRAAACKPWETDRVFDTMVQWAGVGNKISLDKLCKALGLPGKGDIDGSKVWDYVQSGRIAEVADYCADDVRKVWAVYQRMTFARAEVLEDVPEDVPA
jgi:hypothetical protein